MGAMESFEQCKVRLGSRKRRQFVNLFDTHTASVAKKNYACERAEDLLLYRTAPKDIACKIKNIMSE